MTDEKPTPFEEKIAEVSFKMMDLARLTESHLPLLSDDMKKSFELIYLQTDNYLQLLNTKITNNMDVDMNELDSVEEKLELLINMLLGKI